MPLVNVTIDGTVQPPCDLDQIRADFQAIDGPTAAEGIIARLRAGETVRDGGGAAPVFEYSIVTQGQLYDEYKAWCERHALPHIAAEELLHEPLTDAQTMWVKDFIQRWESVVNEWGTAR